MGWENDDRKRLPCIMVFGLSIHLYSVQNPKHSRLFYDNQTGLVCHMWRTTIREGIGKEPLMDLSACYAQAGANER
jgi:hypothetical protein